MGSWLLEQSSLASYKFPSENFSEQQHRGTIRDEGRVYSATQNGKIPFVACEDIAAMAVRALTDVKSHDTEHLVLGPELLTYDEVRLSARYLWNSS